MATEEARIRVVIDFEEPELPQAVAAAVRPSERPELRVTAPSAERAAPAPAPGAAPAPAPGATGGAVDVVAELDRRKGEVAAWLNRNPLVLQQTVLRLVETAFAQVARAGRAGEVLASVAGIGVTQATALRRAAEEPETKLDALRATVGEVKNLAAVAARAGLAPPPSELAEIGKFVNDYQEAEIQRRKEVDAWRRRQGAKFFKKEFLEFFGVP